LLTLLWKAKSDLYAQAVEVQAKREPLVNTHAGNTLGTRLKENILAAIKRRKGPVERCIKIFNDRRRQYLQKSDPQQLLLPANQDLTFTLFLKMDLDDPLWNDDHFYYARGPWALDSNVRQGIKSVMLLDRVEEEIEMLTQELDRSISWACEYRKNILQTIEELRIAALEPIDESNRFAKILKSFPMKGKLRLLGSELNTTLYSHERVMLHWMGDVEILWKKTCSQNTKANHPWFDEIGAIQAALTSNNIGDIDNALEALNVDNVQEDPAEEVDKDDWVDDDVGDDDEVLTE
jgi:hypothetical protein